MPALSLTGRFLWGAAAVLFASLLLSLAALGQIPRPVHAALLAVAAVAAWRTGVALLVIAAVIPVATWFGRTWDGGVAWPEAVAVAFLAGYAVRGTVAPAGDRIDGLTVAIHTMVAVVVSSLAVQLLVLRGTIGDAALGDLLRGLFTGGYFIGNSGLEGVDAAMRLIEGLLLAHAGVSVARADRGAGRRIIGAVVFGAAAAAFLNVWRIWVGSLRVEAPVLTFLRHLATLRYNAHYGDINAAGSYFLMALLPALALARAVSAWRWMLPALLIAVSLVLSGSRAALLAGVAAAAALWALVHCGNPRRASSMRLRSAVVIVILLAAGVSGVGYLALQRNLTPASIALVVRGEYTRISFAMLATRPVFGIGPGQYPVRLPEFATARLLAIYPARNENAHNYFLQILAELGLAGFAAFMTLLGVAFARMLRLVRAGGATLVEQGAGAGLFGFVLTWLAGHPLLVDAPAFSFWPLFGAMAGYAAPLASSAPVAEAMTSSGRHRTGRMTWAAAGLLVAIAASIPVRVQRELADANLEHIGIGVSQWQPAQDGVEFRMAGASSIVFVPSYARVVEIPLRAAATETTLRVALYLDGRPADVVTVRPEAWYPLLLRIPQHRTPRRFRALELRVLDRSAADLLMIGKVRPFGT